MLDSTEVFLITSAVTGLGIFSYTCFKLRNFYKNIFKEGL